MTETAAMAREPQPSPKIPRSATMIRAWRKHHRWSLEQVVERLEQDAEFSYSVGQLSRVERGEYPFNQDLLDALAFVFKTTTHELLGRDPREPESPSTQEIDPEIMEMATRLVTMARRA